MSPLRRRLMRVAVVVGVLVGLLGGYYVGLYFYADRTIDRVAALSPDAPEILAPQLQDGAQTYLVVGTDLPGQSGPAAVTTLLARIDPGGEHGVLVSVPPTALVDTPECRSADGSLRPPATETLAGSLLQGGPSCLVRAAQQLSGLRIDHYVGVDLGALPDVVGSVDGVSVCPSGRTTVAQAEALLGVAPGDDATGAALADREQRLLTATLQAALAVGTLVDPVQASSVLTGTADVVTVDDGTTLADLRSFATGFGDLPAGAVQRTSVPVSRVGYVPAGGGAARVLLDGAATRDLFDSIVTEGTLPVSADDATAASTVPADAAAASDAAPVTVTVPPAGVTVAVLDATAPADLATGPGAATAAALAAQGFVVGSVAVEPAATGATVVRYGAALVEQARAVAAAVPGALLVESAAVGDSVQLVVDTADLAVQPVGVGTPVPDTSTAPAAVPAC